jgi:hypothetical protein
LESGTGDTFFTTVAFPKKRQAIKSIRVVLPKEARKYEYRGDIDGIFKGSADKRGKLYGFEADGAFLQ